MAYINKPPKKRDYAKDERHKARQQIYRTKRWIELRDAKRMNNPLCEVCEMQDKIVPMAEVHHLVSFTNKDEETTKRLAFDYNNLISVCKDCHHHLHTGELKGCYTKEQIEQRLKDLNKINN